MIVSVIAALLLMPALYSLGCALYLILLLIAAFFAKKTVQVVTEQPLNLRLIAAIPAHNEERVVARTIESLQSCDYPTELREIVVIADNCTDQTAAVARKHGAVVLERHDEAHRGKGHALDFFIREYLPLSAADGVAVVDADSTVSRNFFAEISKQIGKGCLAGQVRDTVCNADEGWRPAMQYISLALKNHVRALGRGSVGCSAGLFGNGMFFARDFLLKRGWPAHSIVEDTELGLRLMLEGYPVRYAPEASALALMPIAALEGGTQKARWEFGQLRMAKTFLPQFFRAAIVGRSLSASLWCLDLLTPPLVPLFAVTLLMCLVSCGAFALTASYSIAIAVIVSGLATLLLSLYAVGGLLLSRAPWCVWRSLLALPLYVLFKIRVYVQSALTGGPKQWVRTGR